MEFMNSRRNFLKVSALTGGGILLGLVFPSFETNAAPTAIADYMPNIYIKIKPDGTIVLMAPNPEIGQRSEDFASNYNCRRIGGRLEEK